MRGSHKSLEYLVVLIGVVFQVASLFFICVCTVNLALGIMAEDKVISVCILLTWLENWYQQPAEPVESVYRGTSRNAE